MSTTAPRGSFMAQWQGNTQSTPGGVDPAGDGHQPGGRCGHPGPRFPGGDDASLCPCDRRLRKARSGLAGRSVKNLICCPNCCRGSCPFSHWGVRRFTRKYRIELAGARGSRTLLPAGSCRDSGFEVCVRTGSARALICKSRQDSPTPRKKSAVKLLSVRGVSGDVLRLSRE